jgi:hypothetical protein
MAQQPVSFFFCLGEGEEGGGGGAASCPAREPGWERGNSWCLQWKKKPGNEYGYKLISSTAECSVHACME